MDNKDWWYSMVGDKVEVVFYLTFLGLPGGGAGEAATEALGDYLTGQ